MQLITLNPIPNQTFSISLDTHIYNVTLKLTNFVTSVTIARDNVTLISNSRAIPGFPLIPYTYLENGNFAIITANDEYPHYFQFGVTQFLVYASESELIALRGTA